MSPKIPDAMTGSPGGGIFRFLAWLLALAAVVTFCLAIYLAVTNAGQSGAVFTQLARWCIPLAFLSAACFGFSFMCDCLYASARHTIIHSQLLQQLLEKQQAVYVPVRGVSHTN